MAGSVNWSVRGGRQKVAGQYDQRGVVSVVSERWSAKRDP